MAVERSDKRNGSALMSGAVVSITRDNKIKVEFKNSVGHTVRTIAFDDPMVADQLSIDLHQASYMVEDNRGKVR